ncbi:MAG TPA: DUF488 domain-containing protein [Candidatus Kapabacteria bacterium]|nr:DUF488 domain-containing protein [Candidatus Kapabacteria bacterium]
MPVTIYTVGHSTRTHEQLVELLRAHHIELLIDIRRIPYSRYNPQFNREELDRTMPPTGILYEHLEELGGTRPPQHVLERARSCSERSRGFAEYMTTPAFRRGLDRVLVLAESSRIALMCAEADPSHCHRFWVADALVAHGATVRHITSTTEAEIHPENLFTFGG